VVEGFYNPDGFGFVSFLQKQGFGKTDELPVIKMEIKAAAYACCYSGVTDFNKAARHNKGYGFADCNAPANDIRINLYNAPVGNNQESLPLYSQKQCNEFLEKTGNPGEQIGTYNPDIRFDFHYQFLAFR